MSTWMKMSLPDSASPIMEQLIFFHDHTLFISLMILSTVMYMMMMMFKNKLINRNLNENQMIETTWTIMPALILVTIAIPSLKILYMMEEIINPVITIKTMGHQWFWSYEYSDKNQIEIESYMEKKKKLKKFRLLDVDNRISLPYLTQSRMLISSTDVLHSWTIPSLGLKMDAIPGRLNQISMIINKPGLFFGQCSEICGTNHSFMPIVLESVKMKYFIKWINK
uniref:cytochrome c oxidase subunit 2 n=1 Tax=Oecleopsis sinicus TaxID=1308491 RepID=UPI0021B67A95|nr:cytochrome c oxidase subunit 2 [Oecleopsis sinicus]UVV36476.1 cytochrome c oxidase subunit 2 [Oecleopsis sinicus]